jgi:hypothetical protein
MLVTSTCSDVRWATRSSPNSDSPTALTSATPANLFPNKIRRWSPTASWIPASGPVAHRSSAIAWPRRRCSRSWRVESHLHLRPADRRRRRRNVRTEVWPEFADFLDQTADTALSDQPARLRWSRGEADSWNGWPRRSGRLTTRTAGTPTTGMKARIRSTPGDSKTYQAIGRCAEHGSPFGE